MQTQKNTSLSAALAARGIGQAKPATVLAATIRKDSKYAYQSQHHTEPFSVEIRKDGDGYILKGGFGGAYRMQDVHLFAVTPQGFVELSICVHCHDD